VILAHPGGEAPEHTGPNGTCSTKISPFLYEWEEGATVTEPNRPQPLLRLAPPPAQAPLPADGLAMVWAQTIRALELPSTRMVLTQRSRLASLVATVAGPRAVVEVAAVWLPMVKTRAKTVREALAEVLGRPVALELRGAGR
jgi:hypothetical protein